MTSQHPQPEARKRSRRSDPNTSHEAAATVNHFAARHFELITAALASAPEGLTVHQIAEVTGLDHHAVARRMPELRRFGRAILAVYPRDLLVITRQSPCGRAARVWTAVCPHTGVMQ